MDKKHIKIISISIIIIMVRGIRIYGMSTSISSNFLSSKDYNSNLADNNVLSTTESKNTSTNSNNGWKTVTILYPEKITSSDGELYYQRYFFSFQIKGDSSSRMYVVPDDLYYDKFSSYASKSIIKIKYHSGTAKADNGVSYLINIVDDVEKV